MKINPEKNQEKELEVKGYIGGCWSDCHVYYSSSSEKNGCGWDYTAYKNVLL